MSSNALPGLSPPDHDYAQVWADSTASVLQPLHTPVFTAAQKPAASGEVPASAGEGLAIVFKVSGRLNGQQAFQLSRSDGVRLAQLLMSDAIDPAVTFDETHTDAVNEIFRQFAGMAASACKAKYGAEVTFELQAGKSPQWPPAASAAWLFSAPDVSAIQWTLLLDAELHASLVPAAEAQPKAPEAPPPPEKAAEVKVAEAKTPAAPANPAPAKPTAPKAAAPASTPASARQASPSAAAGNAGNPANLDLLLDVELEASLRFGQREMPLREILDLHPGSVVELNRKIQEPAELLVAGRVIARGEVVIVDGNYGLRITDIAHPRERLESVEIR